MKSFFRFIALALTSFAFVMLLILTTIRFQLLKPQFLISSLNKPEVYWQTQRALRSILRDSLEAGLEKQGVDFEKLSVGERKLFNDKISEITNLITTDKIQDFTENNITQILSYVNGESEKLTFYLPLEKWGFPISSSQQGETVTLTEKTDVEKLIEENEKFPVSVEQIRRLHNSQKNVYLAWQITLATFLMLFIIRFLLGEKSLKAQSAGKLLIMLGSFTLATSALAKVASGSLFTNISQYRQPSQILFSALAPPIIAEMVKLWLIIGLGTIILGLLLIFLGAKLKKALPLTSKPLVSQPQKR